MTCTTHHHACDCREKKFLKLVAENSRLHKQMRNCVLLASKQGRLGTDPKWGDIITYGQQCGVMLPPLRTTKPEQE